MQITFTENEIRGVATSMTAEDVLIYTQPDCPYCEMAKQWLDGHGFPYTECDITADLQCAAEYKRFGAVGTPYLVVRHNGAVRHLRNGFTSTAFFEALA